MTSKYTNFNLLKVEDVGESDSEEIKQPAQSVSNGDANKPSKKTKKDKKDKKDKRDKAAQPSQQSAQQKVEIKAEQQPQSELSDHKIEDRRNDPNEELKKESQQPQQTHSVQPKQQQQHQPSQPPQSTDHSGGKKSKKQAIVTRTIWTFIMVFGFFGCLMAGHAWLIMLVMLCQSLSYREVTALFGFKTEYGVRADNSERDRWSTILNWWVLRCMLSDTLILFIGISLWSPITSYTASPSYTT